MRTLLWILSWFSQVPILVHTTMLHTPPLTWWIACSLGLLWLGAQTSATKSNANSTNAYTGGRSPLEGPYAMTTKHRHSLRAKAKEMFEHGFGGYMKYAFPADELDPIKCVGNFRNSRPDSVEMYEVLGNYSLTLIDSLDALAIFGDRLGFENAVKLVIENVSFDQDWTIQVFEVTIRVLGGLLSAHMLATDSKYGFKINWYHNQLLDLATDLGDRLIPTFKTPTGIPYSRVNLKKGVLPTITNETCTAGAGTLVLEFGILSRLTGDPKYEIAARHALEALWERRSKINLVGNNLNVLNGSWQENITGIGAGIDSFFEYMLKAYILFEDSNYLNMFEEAYAGIMKWIKDDTGFYYKNVNMYSGKLAVTWIDSLSAFFPGVQVLSGHLNDAIKHHYLYYTIWRKYGALPERFNMNLRDIDIGVYPLRPELIESTYALYQATKDPFYLHVGETILADLNMTTRTRCGFASLENIQTAELSGRMESFFLSETLKYLYLLFDEENFVNEPNSNFIFTTEGHFFPLSNDFPVKKAIKQVETHSRICPTIQKLNISFHRTSTRLPPMSHNDILLCHHMIGYTNPVTTDPFCSPRGVRLASSSKTVNSKYAPDNVEIIISVRPNSLTQTPKFAKTFSGVVANSLMGVKVTLSLTKSRTYRIIKLNDDLEIGPAHSVRVPSTGLPYDFPHEKTDSNTAHDPLSPRLRAILTLPSGSDSNNILFMIPALFGPEISHGDVFKLNLVPLLSEQMHIKYASRQRRLSWWNSYIKLDHIERACKPLMPNQQLYITGKIVLVMRGKCSFDVKVYHLQLAGVLGVIVISETDSLVRMMPSGHLKQVNGKSSITIPSFLASRSFGLLVLEELFAHAGASNPNIDPTLPAYEIPVTVGIVDADIADASTTGSNAMQIYGLLIENLHVVELRRRIEV
ncbi:hypothetical protein RTP6_002580 [Batrachochytrium dendrobatidis]